MMRFAALMLAAVAAFAGGWSEPEIILHDDEPAVIYRARWTGSHVVVEVKLAQGFHTFAMDNKRRVEEKLAGQAALATDLPTSIRLSGALVAEGPWMQPEPKDFSKPELRLYAYGFEEGAVFAVKAKRVAGAEAKVHVRAQACTDKVCKNVNLELEVPLEGAGEGDVDLKDLIQVR